MKVRIMGFRNECDAFAEMVRETVDPRYLRSISGFYPNHSSNEGRIYIDIDMPEGARRVPEQISRRDPMETLLEHWGRER